MTDLTRQYALALFSLASEKKEIPIIQEEFTKLSLSMNDESMLFFLHPAFQKTEKKEIIAQLKFTPLLTNFLSVLIDNERFDYFNDILEAYIELVKNQNNLLNVIVKSNSPLTEKQIERIKSKLEKDYNRTVILQSEIDETILAGYKLEFEGYLVDDTVEKRLNDLVLSLKKN